MTKITYLVENRDLEVVGYSKSLGDSKHLGMIYSPSYFYITKLVGAYFGEGYHAYCLTWNGICFKRSNKKG